MLTCDTDGAAKSNSQLATEGTHREGLLVRIQCTLVFRSRKQARTQVKSQDTI